MILRTLAHVTDGRLLEFRPAEHMSRPARPWLVDAGWTGTILELGTAASVRPPRSGDHRPHVILVPTDVGPEQYEQVVALAHESPWVMVIGIHPAQDRTPLVDALAAAGFRSCLHDGVFLYVVAGDHAAELGTALSYPACVRDEAPAAVGPALLRESRRREAAAIESALRWKERAVAAWADSSRGAAADRAELVDLRGHAHELAAELGAIRHTLSWRVTAPLRGVRRLRPGRSR